MIGNMKFRAIVINHNFILDSFYDITSQVRKD